MMVVAIIMLLAASAFAQQTCDSTTFAAIQTCFQNQANIPPPTPSPAKEACFTNNNCQDPEVTEQQDRNCMILNLNSTLTSNNCPALPAHVGPMGPGGCHMGGPGPMNMFGGFFGNSFQRGRRHAGFGHGEFHKGNSSGYFQKACGTTGNATGLQVCLKGLNESHWGHHGGHGGHGGFGWGNQSCLYNVSQACKQQWCQTQQQQQNSTCTCFNTILNNTSAAAALAQTLQACGGPSSNISQQVLLQKAAGMIGCGGHGGHGGRGGHGGPFGPGGHGGPGPAMRPGSNSNAWSNGDAVQSSGYAFGQQTNGGRGGNGGFSGFHGNF